jgi:hypothetical protein
VIQFADGEEPVAVYRGGRREPWLHARIADTSELPDEQRTELSAWLVEVGASPESSRAVSVLVTYDAERAYTVHLSHRSWTDDGHVVDVLPREAGLRFPAGVDSMPGWLRSR